MEAHSQNAYVLMFPPALFVHTRQNPTHTSQSKSHGAASSPPIPFDAFWVLVEVNFPLEVDALFRAIFVTLQYAWQI
jgi:hypothetical protein